jgi:hypothetical protein
MRRSAAAAPASIAYAFAGEFGASGRARWPGYAEVARIAGKRPNYFRRNCGEFAFDDVTPLTVTVRW